MRNGAANTAPFLLMKALMDVDPLSRTETWFHYDELTDETTFETKQHVDGFLEWNRRAQNDSDYSRNGIKNDWWHVARIPNGVVEKWLLEDGIDVFNKDHRKRVAKKLNDPDWRYLRTGLGRV